MLLAACISSIEIAGVHDLKQWCCYAGMQDAVDLLHPLLTDTVDYVKQGALIATALVLMQQPESKVRCPAYFIVFERRPTALGKVLQPIYF